MQVNVRMSEQMIEKATKYADKNGYENLQDFIRETVREKIHPQLSAKEESLVRRLIASADEKNLYVSEKELFKTLRKK